MSKIHIGPHTHHEEVDPHPASQTFDREVNLKAIAWTIALLVGVALVVHVIIYGLIVGFNRFDDKREPRPSPLEAANKQPPPPLPRLQTTPEGDLKQYREDEDRILGKAQWLDQRQGRVRIPIDLAMEIVAGRGLGPEVVGGTPGTPVQQIPGQGRTPPDEKQAGALVQMSRQPAQSQTAQQPQAGQTPPPQERR
ncbi:MAG TPA: hypothetical protein VNM67_13015 [Thermoanaerobaculia bacterium]|jgi:hypothetical protein|nr:hypothetical protein [Thermoanaerobaculia bacterium]